MNLSDLQWKTAEYEKAGTRVGRPGTQAIKAPRALSSLVV